MTQSRNAVLGVFGLLALAWGGGCSSKPAESVGETTEGIAKNAVFGGQIILDWNLITVSEIGARTPSAVRRSRLAAIVQVSVYEAVNSINGKYAPYKAKLPFARGASAEAAALAAAHYSLVALFPIDQASLDASYNTALAGLPAAGQADGVALGVAAAQEILGLRATDGSTAVLTWGPLNPLWTSATGPGVWVPSGPAFAPFIDPQYAFLTPWVMRSPSQFLTEPPYALTSDEYTADYNEVKADGALNSTTRTADQTDAANFWFDPTLNPWNQAARQVTAARKLSLEDTARTFALLNIALADAQIAGYYGKEQYATTPGLASWRPIVAIRAGDTDGNPNTVGDPSWVPLRTTPAHPDFTSLHASQSSAGAVVLNHLFLGHEDDDDRGHRGTVSLDLTSAAGRGQNPPIARHFDSFDGMVDEVMGARVWAGIHTRHADTAGRGLGKQIGKFVIRHSLRRVEDEDDDDRGAREGRAGGDCHGAHAEDGADGTED